MVLTLGRTLALTFFLAQAVSPQACDKETTPTAPPSGGGGGTGGASPSIENFSAADGTRFGVETLATNLELPWSLAFTPDGRLFFTERPGRVRVYTGGRVLPDPALVLGDVSAVGEGGAMGLAVHPDFASNRFMFVLYTARVGSGSVNRVVRFREVNNTLGEPAVILEGIRAASIHNGGRLKFGPDRKLYVTMGDVADTSTPQDLASLNGKILRINEDGTTPSDNSSRTLVFTYGHRNPQGLDWHPVTGDLWATEHGPTGNDEVNLIQAGQNYGWPIMQGAETRANMITAPLTFTPSVAPSGATFYTGSLIPNFRNNFFFACLAGQHLHRVQFDATNLRRIAGHEPLLVNRFGRIRDVINGPDGALYIATSNRSGGGAADDDKIARIVAAR
jgi:glucose/arabinose dehydrogenase